MHWFCLGLLCHKITGGWRSRAKETVFTFSYLCIWFPQQKERETASLSFYQYSLSKTVWPARRKKKVYLLWLWGKAEARTFGSHPDPS